jgi:hypothetical protein
LFEEGVNERSFTVIDVGDDGNCEILHREK